MTRRLAVTTLGLLMAGAASAGAQPPAVGPVPAQIEPRDSIKDGAGKGALAGAAGMVALWAAAANSCGKGCENDAPAAAALVVGAYGAAIGTLVGLVADLDAGPGDVPGVRAGPIFSLTSFRSSELDGRAAAPGVAAALRLSPHISLHVEYTATDGHFTPAPGAVPEHVIQNLVPATSRWAGRAEWIQSRRVSYVFSQLIGVHPRPWGRLRLELLGGVGVQAQENRNYYETDVPGTYHVLDFESPEIGFVGGADVEIALTRHVVLVPMFRYNQMGDPGASLTYGGGVHWRF